MSLPKITFDPEEIKLSKIFEDENELRVLKERSLYDRTPEKIKKIYDDFYLPQALDKRVYTFASFVFSLDGKIGFIDNPAGPLISKKNLLDPHGGLLDFWMLNLLRTYADVIIMGGKTLQVEADCTGHIFDEDLAKDRVNVLKKPGPIPINLIVSLDGTDIPFDHLVFNIPEITTWINTSPAGVEFIEKNWDKPKLIVYPDKITDWEEWEKKIKNFNGTVIFCTGEGSFTDAEMLLYSLRKINYQHVLVESPSYVWHLMQKGLLDEAFINYSSVYAGGQLTFGLNQPFKTDDHPHAKFIDIFIHKSNFIYTRQKLIYDVK